MQYIRFPSSSSSSANVNIHDSAGGNLNSTAGALNVNQTSSVAPVNTTGSGTSSTVSTVKTETAPANAVGFILMALDANTFNIRWRIGGVATAAVGQQLQAGRDSGFVPCGANVSICAESGTQSYDIQWVSR